MGLATSCLTALLIGRFLFDVTPRDAGTYAAIGLALLAVGALAAYLPARRAASVDPVEVLAGE
jgi:putative ABC transport system permease protein